MTSAEVGEASRVLILAPNGRDGAVISNLLAQARLAAQICADLPALVRELTQPDAAVAVVAQEALAGDTRVLEHWIATQPPWSDFPFVLLTFKDQPGHAEPALAVRLASMLGNATVLERPFHPVTLGSAVKTALRARGRQREAAAFMAERERGAAALRASEARFRAIADGMPQLIWSTRASGMHDYFNSRWQEVTGVTPPQNTAADALPWGSLLHPDDTTRVEQDWRAALREAVPFRSEFRLHTGTNDWRWFAGRALPVHDDLSGEVTRWFGSCTDIDDGVRAREALARSTEELERLVDQRTASLQREMLEREKAEVALAQAQKMEAVGQLTGGIAHDFNNLLTAIIGSLQMIGKRSDDPQVRRFADNAQHAAERGARLIQQLLAFARRQRLTPEPVAINRLIGGIGDLLQRAVGSTVIYATDLGEDLPGAFVDSTQLELVLLNLAINARDAMPKGGRLTIRTFAQPEAPADLDDELAPGTYVGIEVTDTGIGMSLAVQERAFEPFFTTKDVGKGTGLGLSQVYGFVRQSGGAVKLRSTPGEGTAVTLYLPPAQTPPAVEVLQAAQAPATRHNARILVVDDDKDVRELVVSMLEELGYRVMAAADGYAALRMLGAGTGFDLLLADVAMPGLSGVDVVRQARHDGIAPPVLYATGYADLGVYQNGLDGEELIRKPYRMAELASHVERALRGGAAIHRH
jgi:PAS domain S-box-containing protein